MVNLDIFALISLQISFLVQEWLDWLKKLVFFVI